MSSELSKDQQEVLDMLTKEYEIPRNIAIRRKTTVQAVYKIINKLKGKGYLTRGFNRGLKKTETTKHFKPPKHLKNYIRLHNQEWNIRIIYKSNFFKKLPKNKVIFIDSNTIRIYEDSIEIYSNELLKFEAEDEWRATALSFNYWQRIFTRLENKLKITIIKEGYNNISLVNYHYAEVNNELAKEYNEKKVKLNIYGTEDGKLWFKIDHSWNLDEAECVHPIKAKPDTTRVKEVFNDIRDNQVYLPSEATRLISNILEAQKNEQGKWSYYAENIKAHTDSIVQLNKTLKKFNEKLSQTDLRKWI